MKTVKPKGHHARRKRAISQLPDPLTLRECPDHKLAYATKKIAQLKASKATKHEAKCYMNPANKACATCALWAGEPGERACEENHDLETDILGSIPGAHRPKMHCEHWKPEEAQP